MDGSHGSDLAAAQGQISYPLGRNWTDPVSFPSDPDPVLGSNLRLHRMGCLASSSDSEPRWGSIENAAV